MKTDPSGPVDGMAKRFIIKDLGMVLNGPELTIDLLVLQHLLIDNLNEESIDNFLIRIDC